MTPMQHKRFKDGSICRLESTQMLNVTVSHVLHVQALPERCGSSVRQCTSCLCWAQVSALEAQLAQTEAQLADARAEAAARLTELRRWVCRWLLSQCLALMSRTKD